LHELAALTRYWRKYPPVHIAVAGYLGLNKSKQQATPQTKDEVMRELSTVAGPARATFVPPIPIRPAEQ
jgi:hypothetical protein